MVLSVAVAAALVAAASGLAAGQTWLPVYGEDFLAFSGNFTTHASGRWTSLVGDGQLFPPPTQPVPVLNGTGLLGLVPNDGINANNELFFTGSGLQPHAEVHVRMQIVVKGPFAGGEVVVTVGNPSPLENRTYTFDHGRAWETNKPLIPDLLCDGTGTGGPQRQSYPSVLGAADLNCAREGAIANLSDAYGFSFDTSYWISMKVVHDANVLSVGIAADVPAGSGVFIRSFEAHIGSGTPPTCPNECSQRGSCNMGVCSCDAGFTGPACELRTCPGDCGSAGGVCGTQDGQCRCELAAQGGDACALANYQTQVAGPNPLVTFSYWLKQNECYPQNFLLYITSTAPNVTLTASVSAPPGVPARLVVYSQVPAFVTVAPTNPADPATLYSVDIFGNSAPVSVDIDQSNVANTTEWAQAEVRQLTGLSLGPASTAGVLTGRLQQGLRAYFAREFESIDSIVFANGGTPSAVVLSARPGAPNCPSMCTMRGCCDGTQTCECTNPSWQGPGCLVPRCVADCNGNGNCVAEVNNASGVNETSCECANGWDGAVCETAVCPQRGDCYRNGNCTGPNECTCEPGFFGADCTCMVDCSTLGPDLVCNQGGCDCPAGFARYELATGEFACLDAGGCGFCDGHVCDCEECLDRAEAGWNPQAPQRTCGFCNGQCRTGNKDEPTLTQCLADDDPWLFDTCVSAAPASLTAGSAAIAIAIALASFLA